MNRPAQLHRLSDPLAVAEHVADLLVARLKTEAHTRRTLHVVLTGGTVAAAVHRATRTLLENPGVMGDIAWDLVHTWWGDERFVPAHDPERNDLEAVRDLLSHVPLPRENLHAFPEGPPVASTAATSSAPTTLPTLLSAAETMAQELVKNAPDEFDLVMLGAGPDGHVASLFPRIIGTRVGDIVAVDDSPKPPTARLSMSMDRLTRTRELWVFATGTAKAAALASAWGGEDLPLGVVTRSVAARGGTVHWFLDEEAASRMYA